MQKSQKSGAAGRPEWNGPWNGMGGRPAAPDFCDFCIFAFFFLINKRWYLFTCSRSRRVIVCIPTKEGDQCAVETKL